MITIQNCRYLLDIQSRDTMNEDLKALGLFGSDRLSWPQVRSLLELRLFLGLKPGRNSREQFKNTPREQIQNLLYQGGFNIDQRFKQLQEQYQNKHRVSVHLVLDRE